MARKKKEKKAEGLAPWLITFSDVMTLLLTFFVLLITFAIFIDPRKVKLVMGSITGTFGVGQAKPDVLSDEGPDWVIEPGPMPPDQDLAQLKPLLWDDKTDDLNFVEHRFVQIFSINTEVLFQQGQVHLTPEGEDLLDEIVPVLQDLEYPVLLTGHTAGLRDELGMEYEEITEEAPVDPSWQMSLHRVLNVYRYLLEQNVDPDDIRVEAFGRFWPRYSNRTEQGRTDNRRVDIILDRRNPEWTQARVDQTVMPAPQDQDEFMYRDFIFDVEPSGP
ncbi:MAG: flagellar motor protein MotB [Desulfonatronovibrio sp.]